MEQWINLSQALHTPYKYGDFSKRYIDYEPDVMSISLSKFQTGYEENQTLKTENLDWHPILLQNKPYLISAKEVTEHQLILMGKDGALHGAKAVNHCCLQLYSKKQLGAKGRGLTKEFYSFLPEFIKEENPASYWLANLFKAAGLYIGVYYARYSGEVEPMILYKYANKAFNAEAYQLSLRPIVLLPTDVEVNIGESDGFTFDTALKIRRAK